MPTAWVANENGKRALLRTTTSTTSPTSACSAGPSSPRCSHSGGRGASVWKVSSVYARNTALRYTEPILVPVRACVYVVSGYAKGSPVQLLIGLGV